MSAQVIPFDPSRGGNPLWRAWLEASKARQALPDMVNSLEEVHRYRGALEREITTLKAYLDELHCGDSNSNALNEARARDCLLRLSKIDYRLDELEAKLSPPAPVYNLADFRRFVRNAAARAEASSPSLRRCGVCRESGHNRKTCVRKATP